MKRVTVNRPLARVEIDIEHLTRIEKALGAKLAARVGILGSKTARSKSAEGKSQPTNAFIGLVHEKGSYSQHIPRRSFLEATFEHKGKRLLRIKGSLWQWFIKGDQSVGRLKKIYASLGQMGEVMVQEAFETGGFGAWPPDAPATIKRKKSSAILIDTGQLRRAITSDVVSR